MIRAVVIDVDDTLCLTEAASFALENEVLSRLGRPPVARDVHLATWGEPLLEAMRVRSPGVDLDHFAAVHQVLMRQYIEDGRLDSIPPENLTALDQIIAAGRAVMLLTSRTGPEVAHLLADDHALARRVSAIYHLDNVRFPKPDPRAFDELLAATGYPVAQCVYVGDSLGDARAACGAGLRFIACMQSGVRKRADFAPYPVAAFIDAFPDIVTAITVLDGARRDIAS